MPIILLVVFIALLVAFFPFAIIWALNTLFPLAIAYTFKTWLAVLVLVAAFGKATVTLNHKS